MDQYDRLTFKHSRFSAIQNTAEEREHLNVEQDPEQQHAGVDKAMLRSPGKLYIFSIKNLLAGSKYPKNIEKR